jgi:outer membrane protein TolC
MAVRICAWCGMIVAGGVRAEVSQEIASTQVAIGELNAVEGFGSVPLEYPAALSQEPMTNAVTADPQAPNFDPAPHFDQAPPIDEPTNSGPYWIRENRLAIKASIERTAAIDIESMVWASLAHSPLVQSIQTRPMILETEIDQARGTFDPARFANSIWNDRSDPVGNTLTTGGPKRLNEQNLETKAGVRRKNELGGSLEAAQELSLLDSNSVFFQPRKQADSKMLMRYTQPLMKGYGRTYNRASITIAELNFEASNQEANQALQTHVMDLNEAFWQLVSQRAQTLQINRGLERMKAIHQQLENRADLDLLHNQLLRAGSAISGLHARRARSLAQVVVFEEQLRQIVNAPWIQPNVCDEIVPTTIPLTQLLPINLEHELASALNGRSDILAIRDQIQAANVKLRVAEQDLRPTLNLVTDFYVRGLNGQYDVSNSFGDQFSTGAPSYSGGLEYLRPKNQTLANAIRRQRNLEIRQLLFDLEDRLLVVGKEVRIAIASVQASHAEMEASAEATIANNAEVEYLESKWQNGTFLDPTQISLNLEQLLDAQQRLIQSEANWASAQSQYMIAIAQLRFASGTLLSVEKPILSEPSQAEIR